MDLAGPPPSGERHDPAWESPPRRSPDPAATPMLSVDGFEGPLDWLLELARARQIDLKKISIVALVTAFEAALLQALARPALAAVTLARWGDWLVMAADLTVLRSRLLLASDPAEARDAEAHAEAMRRQWIGRAEIAAATDWLDQRTQLGREVFARGLADTAGPATRGRAGDITALLRACLVALELPDDPGAAYQLAKPPLWTAADAIARIRRRLPDLGEAGDVFAAFLPTVPANLPDRLLHCRAAVANTLVGALELARQSEMALSQEVAFGLIVLARQQT